MSTSGRDSLLDALASGGLDAIPAERFTEVAQECHEKASETGDARYPVLEQLVLEVLDWWSDYDERGGVPRPIVDRIDRAITSELPSVLESSDSADAYGRARHLADELRDLLTGPSDWISKGYLSPP